MRDWRSYFPANIGNIKRPSKMRNTKPLQCRSIDRKIVQTKQARVATKKQMAEDSKPMNQIPARGTGKGVAKVRKMSALLVRERRPAGSMKDGREEAIEGSVL